MDSPSPDRAEQIAGVAALSDPVRRSLYDYVVGQGHEVSRDEAARATGVSRNLASVVWCSGTRNLHRPTLPLTGSGRHMRELISRLGS
jgi:hypothetical protein